METGIKIGIDGTGAQSGGRTVTRTLDEISAAAGKSVNAVGYLKEAVIGLVGAFSVWKLAELIKESTRFAAQAESMSVVLKKVAENVGYTGDQIDELTESVAKMGMTNESARQTLTKMIQTNISLSNATKLTTIAQNAAVIAHTSTADALDQMNVSISTGMERTLKHMGIIVDFSRAEKDYAQTLGKNVSLLTEKEKTQARVNDVMRASSQINGVYAASLGTAEGIMKQLSIATEETKDEFGKLFLPIYKAILTELLASMKDIQSWFEHNKGTVAEWSDSLLHGFYAVEAEVTRMAMLLDKAGMLLYSFGNAIGNKNSMEHYLEYQKRYIENEKQMQELALKTNAVGIPTPTAGNGNAAKAGAAATAMREQAAASALLIEYNKKLISSYSESHNALMQFAGSNVEQANAEEMVYKTSKQYFDLLQDANSGNFTAKQTLANIDLVLSLKEMRAAYADLHANDDLKNSVANLKVEEDPYASQMNMIEQNYKQQKDWDQDLLDSKLLTLKQEDVMRERMALLDEERTLKLAALKKQMEYDHAAVIATTLGQIGGLMMQGNKKQFEEGKKLAEAEALINGALAITKVLSQTGVYGIIAAVGIAASTATQLNQIRNQTYQGKAAGGALRGGTPGVDSIPIMAMEDEYILKASSARKLGLARLEYMNATGELPRFSLGGFIKKLSPTNLASSLPQLPGTTSASDALNLAVGNPQTLTNLSQGLFNPVKDWRESGRVSEEGKRQHALVVQLNAVNAEFEKLGMSLLPVSEAGKTAADTIIGLTGGMEEFTSKLSDYHDAFYTQSEKDALLRKQVDDELKKVSLTLPDTRSGFRKLMDDLVSSGDIATESGAKQYAALLNAAKGADTLYQKADALQEKLKSTIDDILSGPLGMLSPENAYAKAKTAFGSATGDELPDAAKALLEASKNYNAGGVAYQSDLQLVLTTLGALAGVPVGAHATGGIASGWSMVGERGPELVNFTNPARVYTAHQTRAAMGGGNDKLVEALIEEVRALRQEVAQLTGHAAAGVRVSQAGFSRTIAINERQEGALSTMARKISVEATK